MSYRCAARVFQTLDALRSARRPGAHEGGETAGQGEGLDDQAFPGVGGGAICETRDASMISLSS